MAKLTIKVDGIHCLGCALGIEEQLEKMLGFIISAKSDFETGAVELEYMEECFDMDMVKSSIERIGLKVVEE
ncbi:MAG: heavy-metal-associated domain-containing protein [Clostridia bacterium]